MRLFEMDNRRKAVEILTPQLVRTFIILLTLHCIFLTNCISVDLEVENKSDTIYRNLNNKLNRQEERKRGMLRQNNWRQTVRFTHKL
jgi:hypothetical protein